MGLILFDLALLTVDVGTRRTLCCGTGIRSGQNNKRLVKLQDTHSGHARTRGHELRGHLRQRLA